MTGTRICPRCMGAGHLPGTDVRCPRCLGEGVIGKAAIEIIPLEPKSKGFGSLFSRKRRP